MNQNLSLSAVYQRRKMEKRVTFLGWLYIIVFSAFYLSVAVAILFVAAAGMGLGEKTAISSFVILEFVSGIIGGIGLLKRKSWARILVLILSFLNLIYFPLGTLLGVYAIWVLTKNETVRLFASGASS